MRVAYQGVAGAFGHEACLAFVPGHEPLPCDTFAAVIETVTSDGAALGMLPLANNAAGETGARALIEGAPLRIVAEHDLAVRMHLAALPGVPLERVTAITSHPVALGQCSRVLEELGLPTREAANTAIAAARLSGEDAVLASESAAALYGLTILRRDVQDRADNLTRFAVVARA